MLRQINLKIAAGTEEVIALKGNYVRVKTAPYDLQIRNATDSLGDIFIMSEGDSANFGEGFERLAFKNMGSGDTVFSLIIGKNSGVDSSKIGGAVQVVNGEISRVKSSQCFIGVSNIVAAAGQFPQIQLWNPAGSGKNLILTRMTFLSGNGGAIGAIGLLSHTAQLANLQATPATNKYLGAALGVAQLRNESNAVLVGGAVGFANCAYSNNDSVVEYPLIEPIVIVQGRGVGGYHTALGSNFHITFQWYEESA